MKVVLTGNGSVYNHGCEALTLTTCDILRQLDNEIEISVISRDYRIDKDLESREARVKVWDLYHDNSPFLHVAKALLRRLIPSRFDRPFYYSKLLADSKIVFSLGGDNFTQDYGSPKPFFDELDEARAAGCTTVIWGASIGPFTEDEAVWIEKLKKVDLITVRERKSYEYLQSRGVLDNLLLVPDSAFILKSRESLLMAKMKDDKKGGIEFLGLGMSDLISLYDDLTEEEYLDTFVGISKKYLEQSPQNRIVLIPHVNNPRSETTGTNNDYALCKKMAAIMNNDERVLISDKQLDAGQLKGVISQLDYFIGARTHSTIASLSSCVPTISVAYSTKAYGINELIFSHEDFVVPMSEINEENMWIKLTAMRDGKKEITSHLQNTIPRVQEKCLESIQLLRDRFFR